MRWLCAPGLVLAFVASACANDPEAASPAPVPTPSVTAPASPGPSTEPSPSRTPAPLPSPITTGVEHGGTYFGVYLAVAPFDTPELQAAVEQLAALGIEAFPGSIACDQGAAAQLGVREDLAAVAVYFERFREATRFARALDPSPLGIARVQTFCAD